MKSAPQQHRYAPLLILSAYIRIVTAVCTQWSHVNHIINTHKNYCSELDFFLQTCSTETERHTCIKVQGSVT